jgi:hypothetical protein
MNVDVEIYINNIINFFENNPNDLSILIGDFNKEKFYDEIKLAAYRNYRDNKEVELTKKQLIEIVLKLTKHDKSNAIFLSTKIGEFCLN